MTDFYSNMTHHFRGRANNDSTKYSTHTVMETKLFQSPHHEEICTAKLISMPLNLASIDVFVNAFFKIHEQENNSALLSEKDCILKIKGYQSNHNVSYSWLDACIAHMEKLPEEPYFTV